MKHLSLDLFDYCSSSSSKSSGHRVSLMEDLDFSGGGGKSDGGNSCVHVSDDSIYLVKGRSCFF